MELEHITEEQLIEVLQKIEELSSNPEVVKQAEFYFENFAQHVYNPQAYSPFGSSDLMKNHNLNVRTPAGEKEILEALANPSSNEQQLVGWSQGFYFSSLMYKRNHEYLVNLPAFDLEPRCINAKKKDLKSKEYKEDREAVKDFLNKFDYRNEFRKMLWSMLSEETAYVFVRECEDKTVLQSWPWKHAQLTGRFEYGYLYDIDMSYFQQSGVDLNDYPSWIKSRYIDVFHNSGNKPNSTLNKRTSKYATWVQTNPEDGVFAFKFTDKHNLQVPFFTGMLPEMAILPLMRELQKNQSIAAARKLLTSSVPYLTNQKSGSVVNNVAIDSTLLGKFLAMARQGITESIKVLALPTNDIKGIEYTNSDPNSYNKFVELTSGILGGGKVIFAEGTRMTALQTQLALDLDRHLVTSVYPQFEDFLNYFVNKKTKKFKWKFKFVGTQDWLDKEARRKEAFEFADKGIVLPTKLASSLGMNVFELEDELDSLDASGFIEKLRIMPNVNTISGESVGKGGRPIAGDGKLSDSGAATRDNASNVERGGEI